MTLTQEASQDRKQGWCEGYAKATEEAKVQIAAIKAEHAKEIAAMQAKIDALMLEYCPNEMTKEQLDEWALHQKPVVKDCLTTQQPVTGSHNIRIATVDEDEPLRPAVQTCFQHWPKTQEEGKRR